MQELYIRERSNGIRKYGWCNKGLNEALMTMTENIKYGFVILHYMETDITEKCIEKICTTLQGGYAIVVVDNGSPNKSGEVLKQKYGDHKQIEVIMNSNNDGFARGNNLGFDFVRDKYEPKFIIVMNNDILIEQEDFLERIESVYRETEFGVLGPDILSLLDGTHQNPLYLEMPTYETIKSWFEGCTYKCMHPYISYLKLKVKPLIKGKNNISHENEISVNGRVSGCVLCGACYIFGPDFIEKRKYCFNPQTLFYGEELLLYQECQLQGIKMYYDPMLKVLHLHGGTARKSCKLEFARYRRANLGLKIAHGLLLELMDDH